MADPMQMLAGASGGGQPPAGGGSPPPMEAGMQTPQPPEGQNQMVDVQVKLAMDVLSHTLPLIPPGSEKAASIRKSLDALTKTFGEKASQSAELMPAQIASLLGSLPGSQSQPLSGGAQPPMLPQ